jgi:hypothetical protein
MLRATVADDAAHSPRLHPIRSFFVCEESARRRRRRLQRGSPSAAQTAAMTAGKWRAWAMSGRTTWGNVGETRTTRARDKPKVGCVVSKLLPENRANKRLALALQTKYSTRVSSSIYSHILLSGRPLHFTAQCCLNAEINK